MTNITNYTSLLNFNHTAGFCSIHEAPKASFWSMGADWLSAIGTKANGAAQSAFASIGDAAQTVREKAGEAATVVSEKFGNATEATLTSLKGAKDYMASTFEAGANATSTHYTNLKGRVSEFAADVKSNEKVQAFLNNSYVKGTIETVAPVLPFVGGGIAGALSANAVINLAKTGTNKLRAMAKLATGVAIGAVCYANSTDEQVKTLAITTAAGAALSALKSVLLASAKPSFQSLKANKIA